MHLVVGRHIRFYRVCMTRSGGDSWGETWGSPGNVKRIRIVCQRDQIKMSTSLLKNTLVMNAFGAALYLSILFLIDTALI